jgi:hypothetical protein
LVVALRFETHAPQQPRVVALVQVANLKEGVNGLSFDFWVLLLIEFSRAGSGSHYCAVKPHELHEGRQFEEDCSLARPADAAQEDAVHSQPLEVVQAELLEEDGPEDPLAVVLHLPHEAVNEGGDVLLREQSLEAEGVFSQNLCGGEAAFAYGLPVTALQVALARL